MKRSTALFAAILMCATMMWAAEEDRAKVLSRVQAAQEVLNEIMSAPDKGIPEEILSAADCAIVIPSMMKGGFVFGAQYGKGVATCRTTDDHWSAPAPVRIEGGSFGLQIGGEAVDLVMLVMNKQGAENLLNSKFKIGADVSGAAGPVGRSAEGSTDWKLRAQVLTYSRARGAFAGISLNGAVIKQDTDDTVALYGKDVSFTNILTGKVPPPPGTQPFVAEVAKYFRQARAEETTKKAAYESGTAGGAAGTAAARGSTPSPDTGTSGSGVTGNTQTETKSSTQSSTTTATRESTAPQSSMGAAPSSPDQAQTNIQNALQNAPGVSTQNVSVSVAGDTVVVSGSVPNQKDKATITRIVSENSGGRKVDDSNLIVK
jgi:lipid-binding SYLF domain-containing protein